MTTPVTLIKEKLSILDVARLYLKVEKAGRNFKARCPFHNEKTPSFFLSPERNSYYCFGCGAKGDIFTLTEHFEGVDFRGALSLLGTRAGVEIDTQGSRAPQQKGEEERLRALLESALMHFKEALTKHKDARAYLRARGLSEKAEEEWRLGYAPDLWRTLTARLLAEGYTEKEIENAGCGKVSEKGMYDRFRGRIMFPLFDTQGRVVGFSGRLFPGKEAEGAPKYLNSPETILFKKSHLLYGLDRAKGSIRKNDFSIVVEGQMDLLMMHQSGFTNTVATSGTSLTEDHLSMLRRFSDNVVLAMDGDEAGVKSIMRGATYALHAGMNVKVAQFPEGRDPADLANEDREALKKIIRSSLHVVEFLVNHIQQKGYDERKFRLMVQKEVFPFVRLIENRVDQSHFIQRLANRLNLPEEVVETEVKRLAPSGEQHRGAGVPEAKVPDETPRSLEETVLETLIAILLLEEREEEPVIDTALLRNTLTAWATLPERGEVSALTPEVLFTVEKRYSDRALLPEDVEGLLSKFRLEGAKKKKRELQRSIKEAEERGDTELAEKLLASYSLLLKEDTH